MVPAILSSKNLAKVADSKSHRGRMEEDKREGRIYFGSLRAQNFNNHHSNNTNATNQQGPRQEPVVLEFTQEVQKATKKHQALLDKVEFDKRARSIAVPTNDNSVRERLRSFGEPITLFGEGERERRERLRILLAEREIATPTDTKTQKYNQTDVVGAPKGTESEELYYTEGTPKLKETRQLFAQTSFSLANQRIKKSKEFRENITVATFQTEVSNFNNLKQNLHSFQNSASYIGDERPLSYCHISPDQNRLVTTGLSGTIKVWEFPYPKQERCSLTIKAHTGRVGCCIWNPKPMEEHNTAHLASGGLDNVLKIWSTNVTTTHNNSNINDTSNNYLINQYKGHTDRICRIAWHPIHNSYVATTSGDCTWKLWDLNHPEAILTQDGHSKSAYGIAFQLDGSLVATSGLDSYVRIWDLRSGKSVMVLRGHAKGVLGLDWSPNGYHVASGSEDNTIKMWDIRKRSCVYTILAHMSSVSHLRIEKENGRVMVSSGFDKTVRLWSCRDGSGIVSEWRQEKVLSGHEGLVSCADITDGGRCVVSAALDRTWKVWKGDEEVKLAKSEKPEMQGTLEEGMKN